MRLDLPCASLKTLPITTHLICLQNTARVILFSMMISRCVTIWFVHAMMFSVLSDAVLIMLFSIAFSLLSLCSYEMCWLQGTASVVLAGLLSSLKIVGGTLAEHTYLFLGAGEVSEKFSRCNYCCTVKHDDAFSWTIWWCILLQAGTGIAELIALEISKQVTNFNVSRC